MRTTYDIFARREHPEPLTYIGSVEVERPADAAKASLEKFGPQSDWLEMVAVPHEQVILVFSERMEPN